MAAQTPFLEVRTYEEQAHKIKVQELEKKCEVVTSWFTQTTNGDPFCRIQHIPISTIMVAELGTNLVGVIRGTVKQVSLPSGGATVGYILGLRVSPLHRRKGVGTKLVAKMEGWFVSKEAEYAYMATGEDNRESVGLFVGKLKYEKIKSLAIVVNPVVSYGGGGLKLSPLIGIAKLGVEEAEALYREYMGSADFFPKDIAALLRNKHSVGTWVGWWCKQRRGFLVGGEVLPESWAMGSVWESVDGVKVRREKKAMGFYFVYGVHCEGRLAGEVGKGLLQFVNNMGERSGVCGAVVTEVGGGDSERMGCVECCRGGGFCVEDVWCMKFIKKGGEVEGEEGGHDFMKRMQGRAVFVDPREL